MSRSQAGALRDEAGSGEAGSVEADPGEVGVDVDGSSGIVRRGDRP